MINSFQLFIIIMISVLVGYIIGYCSKFRKKQNAQHQDLIATGNAQPKIPFLYFKSFQTLDKNQLVPPLIDELLQQPYSNSKIDLLLFLAQLYRAQGEVDYSIKIHHQLMAIPHLNVNLCCTIQLELAKDFIHSGLIDRAENILIQLLESVPKKYEVDVLVELLFIYEQSHEWENAIKIATQLLKLQCSQFSQNIAFYYCELAEFELQHSNYLRVRKYLKLALKYDKSCPKIYIVFGKLAFVLKNYKKALQYFELLGSYYVDFVPIVIDLLKECYVQLKIENRMKQFLLKCLRQKMLIPIVLEQYAWLKKNKSPDIAIHFLMHILKHTPNSNIILVLYDDYLDNYFSNEYDVIIKNTLAFFRDTSKKYFCNICHTDYSQFYWQCPKCHAWASVYSGLISVDLASKQKIINQLESIL